jgi:dTDP-4-dehydrorhamnose 3,5-epimerase
MGNERFTVTKTPISDLLVVEAKPISDSRGFFCRLFCPEELGKFGFRKPISQVNQTYTRKSGAVRGMHFQFPPYAECKIVFCIRGSVYDVAVDIRKDSATFLKWHAEIISPGNKRGFLIPEGFAHGFQTLEDDCELLYFHSEIYNSENEGALNVFDPGIGITWPLAPTDISDRDRMHPFVNDKFEGISR